MNVSELLEGIRFGPADYDELLSDPSFRVGYEIEFVYPDLGSWQDGADAIKKQLIPMGIKIGSSSHGRTGWGLVPDLSIRSQDSGRGYELISPPMPLEQALTKLESIFNWMVENNCVTNSTTGFHVGVSRGTPAATRKIDPLKVVLLMGERYLMNLFDRELNNYSSSHIRSLFNKLQTSIYSSRVNWILFDEFDEILKRVRSQLRQDKYWSVNLGKLQDKGYLEFRVMGNTDYHKRFDDIKKTILRYCFLVKIAGDPQAYRREYLTELGKLLIKVLSARAPDWPDLPRDQMDAPLATKHPQRLQLDRLVRGLMAGMNPKSWQRNYLIASKLKAALENSSVYDQEYLVNITCSAIEQIIKDASVVNPQQSHLSALALKILLTKAKLPTSSIINHFIQNDQRDLAEKAKQWLETS